MKFSDVWFEFLAAVNMETVFFRVRIIRSLTEVHRRFRGTSFLYCKCILTSHPAILIIVLSYSIQFFISVLCLYASYFYSVISLTLLAHLKPKNLTVLGTVFFPLHSFFWPTTWTGPASFTTSVRAQLLQLPWWWSQQFLLIVDKLLPDCTTSHP
jgi:hypothetical protein